MNGDSDSASRVSLACFGSQPPTAFSRATLATHIRLILRCRTTHTVTPQLSSANQVSAPPRPRPSFLSTLFKMAHLEVTTTTGPVEGFADTYLVGETSTAARIAQGEDGGQRAVLKWLVRLQVMVTGLCPKGKL